MNRFDFVPLNSPHENLIFDFVTWLNLAKEAVDCLPDDDSDETYLMRREFSSQMLFVACLLTEGCTPEKGVQMIEETTRSLRELYRKLLPPPPLTIEQFEALKGTPKYLALAELINQLYSDSQNYQI